MTRPGRMPSRSYVICTLPRSGSTLLCRMLTATGVAGAPGSHFHRPSLSAWLEDYSLCATAFASERAAVEAVFAAALATGLSTGLSTGMAGAEVFGLRMQGHSFAHFLDRLRQRFPDQATDAARMAAAFGPVTYVHLSRDDRVAQAVSRLRAEQSGLWHRRADGSDLERVASDRAETGYDADALTELIAEARAGEAMWQAWFAQEGIVPLRVSYEALSANPRGTLADLLEALGLDPLAAEGVVPSTAKLADDVSAAWCARYRAERSEAVA